MPNKKISELDQATSTSDVEQEWRQGGNNVRRGSLFRGNYDASGNAYPSSGGSGTGILAGDTWRVSVAGNLDILGLGVTAVEVGAMLIAWVDGPGQTPANWKVIQ